MPYEVQEFLKEKSFDDLTKELGIVVKKHDTLPLAILNYDQIESPKSHPIVRHCRGLVLHTETKEVVARSFSRFFNWGEMADEMGSFDFSNFIVQSKEDGSLVVLYYYDGQWHANTRGSFAIDYMQGMNFTWREGICRALGIKDLSELDNIGLDRSVSYVCEFCSPWNKIVRRYEKPVMYILTAFRGVDEIPWDGEELNLPDNFLKPTVYAFRSMEQIQQFLNDQAERDQTFEGVVIRDAAGRRWKIKNACYLALHRLRGEGNNLFMPKNLLPFILSGEEAELLVYFPEVEESFRECQNKVNQHFEQLANVWKECHKIEDQKEFALSIKGKTPFTGILFSLKKRFGNKQTFDDLKSFWRLSEDIIIKTLFR